ncbi:MULTISPECIES: hypothetical protein [Brachyspira]|uniref:Adenylosuccinate synthase n=1 Tax=Brachyspira murdochii (strain ATCC 51284 / DSM 12563 / 56-150) TaxID=526224 RepID=D5UAR8_BRAM5|nr:MULTISPECIES: hypothetical protein [Brachyspira]ADG71791.1 hypothetical protein Bmur_1706 [Brachyspira murdochii DSM 12563]WPC23181.1 adenylosuccinate synthase [Brachyspira hyodysenteriae]WPC23879.1 adenylosuccinate synthase [Brachyspira hyodysenteriae]WPC24409.1 adenylosuccinate synthase [Brachyspira hyodysenteriae]WPC25167.1 adenylosuccinate synthase [Brachyspira hyodysenteriae]
MKKIKKITHSDLCRLTAKYFLESIALIEYKCLLVKENPDVLIFDNYSNTTLYEIKTDVKDFRRDLLKPHRIVYKLDSKMRIETFKSSIGTNRYYVCPEGLIKKEDLPIGWGLIWYYDNGNFKIQKKSGAFKIDKGLENRLLINTIKRINHGKCSNILIRDYIEYE